MCKLPEDATWSERLKHDFENTYYRFTILYIALMVTAIFVAIIT